MLARPLLFHFYYCCHSIAQTLPFPFLTFHHSIRANSVQPKAHVKSNLARNQLCHVNGVEARYVRLLPHWRVRGILLLLGEIVPVCCAPQNVLVAWYGSGGYIVRVRGYLLEYYASAGFTSERVLDLSCKLNTYYHMWIALFYSLKFTMFSLPSLLHIHKNYLHAGIQECDMMISPTSLIKHCKIRDYAGPPRVTFQGSCLRGDSGCSR